MGLQTREHSKEKGRQYYVCTVQHKIKEKEKKDNNIKKNRLEVLYSRIVISITSNKGVGRRKWKRNQGKGRERKKMKKVNEYIRIRESTDNLLCKFCGVL